MRGWPGSGGSRAALQGHPGGSWNACCTSVLHVHQCRAQGLRQGGPRVQGQPGMPTSMSHHNIKIIIKQARKVGGGFPTPS